MAEEPVFPRYIFGLHEPGGEFLMEEKGKRGWILFTHRLGHEPKDQASQDYRQWSDRGFGIIARLNHDYGPAGTLPLPEHYDAFAQCVRSFVANSHGCHVWVIGNEMNHGDERPEGQPITPDRYAACYKQCWDQVHSIPGHDSDQVAVGAVAPWNNTTTYPGNENGDWVKYMVDILEAIQDRGCVVDALTLHTYTHGQDPNLVFSGQKMSPPFQDYHYHFRCYRDFMDAIPPDLCHIPVYITETDEDEEWEDANRGWVQNAYKEVNDWNSTPGNQQIRALILYRWPKFDKWHIEGKEGVYDDFRAAMDHEYAWKEMPHWSSLLPGYATDTARGDDLLGIGAEVSAFSSVIAAKNVSPPLCLGLFGDWGSGKSFLMGKMAEQIDRLAAESRRAQETDLETAYCSHIVQITFNAWHYIDANLWASLVSHIFEGLDTYIVGEGKEEKRQQLLQELKLAAELREEAQREQDAARQRLEEVEGKLEQARFDREQASLKLRHLLASLSLENILEEEQKAELHDLAGRLGLPRAFQNVDELNSALRDTRTLWGRLKVALFAPENRGLGLVWLLIVLVAVPLVGVGVNWLLNQLESLPEFVDAVATVLVQLGTFAASVAGGLNHLLRRTTPVVDGLESVLDKARAALQAQREQISEEEAGYLAQLPVLENRETAAIQALEDARARVDRAEVALQELETASDSRRLAEFIQERATSQEYKRHLGVISTIRKDLEFLSNKLNAAREGRQEGAANGDANLPQIDRIVLYIDDLDRCPEQRVVEVLQAVHLLLAFELFVVVVAVDSRWLLRALEEVYPTLRGAPRDRAGWSEEEVWAWQSTPQNYLEKIFQIPYNLRPMDQTGFQRLVNNLLPSTTPASPGVAPPIGGVADTRYLSEETETDQTRQPSVQALEGAVIGRERRVREEPALSLNPAALRIEDVEREFMAQLASLIFTPRAAKRFINIYRLMRATVPDADLSSFVGDAEQPGEYRVVMILLAILTGFSQQAPYIFRKILSSTADSRFDSVLGATRPQQIPGTAGPQYRNNLVPVMNAGEAIQWKRLYMALSALRQGNALPDDLSPYITWTSRVARYSFRVGKIVGDQDLAADVRITHIELGPPGLGAAGEYVRIENRGDAAQPMTGWTLSDAGHHTFTFPQFVLPAGGMVQLWGGVGENTATDLYWQRQSPVWNDAGDVAELRDTSGILVASYTAEPVQ